MSSTQTQTPTPDVDPNFLPLPNRRKVVIRDLPPALTEEQLLADLERLGISKSSVDYFRFVPGHIPKRNIVAALHMGGSTFHFDPATTVGGKRPRPGQCYIQFKTPEEPIEFAQQYNGHVFVDSKGVQYPVRVEFALYQQVPADSAHEIKVNPAEGTWQETPEYKQWMEMRKAAAKKAKEPVVFDVKGDGPDDTLAEPPKNAILSKVAKNAAKLLAKARSKSNGGEPVAASVPVAPSPVAMAILTPKGPKTTPLIEYLKQQREIKLKKAKAAKAAVSSRANANISVGKQQQGSGPGKAGGANQAAPNRPNSGASSTKAAAAGQSPSASATVSASDKKAKKKELLKEKRKEKDRERREKKKAEKAAAKAAAQGAPPVTTDFNPTTEGSPAAAGKLPTPATSKKAAAKLKKEMASFTPTVIQKRVNPTTPAPAPTDDDDEAPILPFNLVQVSSASSSTQRPTSPISAPRATSPVSVSSTAAQRGSSPAPSMLSVISNNPAAQGGEGGQQPQGEVDEDGPEEKQSQQEQQNLSLEERTKLEKLRLKREKRKEKAKEKRKAERIAAKEAKKAARAAAPPSGADGIADGDDGTCGAGQAQVGHGAGADSGEVVDQLQDQSSKPKFEKKKRERPNKNKKNDKEQSADNGLTTESPKVDAGGHKSSRDTSQASDHANSQPSWAKEDTSSSTEPTWDSTTSSSTATNSTRGGGNSRGGNVCGGGRGNRSGSTSSAPPKSPPMQAVNGETPDWATAGEGARADEWAAGPQQQQHRESTVSTRGGGASGRGGMRGSRGGGVPRGGSAARANEANLRTAASSAANNANGAAHAGDWTNASDDANAAYWKSQLGPTQPQQSRRESQGSVSRGGFAGGNRGRGAPPRGGFVRGGANGGQTRGGSNSGGSANSASNDGLGGRASTTTSSEWASVSDWAASGDWSSGAVTKSGAVDWAGSGDTGPTTDFSGLPANRGGGSARPLFARGGSFRGDFRGGRGRGGAVAGNRQGGNSGGGSTGTASSSWTNE